ncbi:MAG: phytanoyl-CoA dioxygenase family protein [Ectothiorhodospiraceae bacterium AqS1]|nr:phytanoyl-CoA dioxygenase family protein [Ectothiorhodospiraceae bacterium AqS1]
MDQSKSEDWKEAYERDGFLSPVRIIEESEASEHRRHLEEAEAQLGPLHYKAKVHTILRSPLALALHPKALDVVQSLLGPDILLYNVSYIIKEPKGESHVSWHQDLTYWGFDRDEQVSMWLALSPASSLSGCMRMIPGSHLRGQMPHITGDDETNILFQSQSVADVDEADSVQCPLAPGEASFHHGRTLHASTPNRSDDRRIGLNIQYISPRMRQTKHDADTALSARGRDRFGHFGEDIPAAVDLDPAALIRWRKLDEMHRSITGTS